MHRQTLYVTLPICAAVLAAGTWLVRAGDLNPPAGPVSPTMKTLDEIYDAVTVGLSSCPACTWEYKYVDELSCVNDIEVLPAGTTGILHGLWVTTPVTIANGEVGLANNIGRFSGASGESNFIQLDVPFDDGLQARCEGTGVIFTVLYQSTP